MKKFVELFSFGKKKKEKKNTKQSFNNKNKELIVNLFSSRKKCFTIFDQQM